MLGYGVEEFSVERSGRWNLQEPAYSREQITASIYLVGSLVARAKMDFGLVQAERGVPLIWILGKLCTLRKEFAQVLSEPSSYLVFVNGRPAEWWDRIDQDSIVVLMPQSVFVSLRPDCPVFGC